MVAQDKRRNRSAVFAKDASVRGLQINIHLAEQRR